MEKTRFLYNRAIKLGPAIGDWTTLKQPDDTLDEIQISQVQNVNFDSLPRDEMKALHHVHYRLAEHVVKQLSEDMNIKVELHTVLASQVSYEDYLQSQNDRVVQANYAIKDMGTVNVIFSWELADMMVDRLTGGEGQETDRDGFNTTETTILEAQMESLIPYFRTVWRDTFKKDAITMDFSSGAHRYDPKISLREAYIMFSFYMFFGNGDLKKMVWAYPNHLIRTLIQKEMALPKRFDQNINLRQETLKKSRVDVAAFLGATQLTMGEIKNLQIGDVIKLDAPLQDPVKVDIGQDLKVHAQPGVFSGKVGIQLFGLDALASSVALGDVESEEDAVSDEVENEVEAVVEENLEEKEDTQTVENVEELQDEPDEFEQTEEVASDEEVVQEEAQIEAPVEEMTEEDLVDDGDFDEEAAPEEVDEVQEEIADDDDDFSWDSIDEDLD